MFENCDHYFQTPWRDNWQSDCSGRWSSVNTSLRGSCQRRELSTKKSWGSIKQLAHTHNYHGAKKRLYPWLILFPYCVHTYDILTSNPFLYINPTFHKENYYLNGTFANSLQQSKYPARTMPIFPILAGRWSAASTILPAPISCWLLHVLFWTLSIMYHLSIQARRKTSLCFRSGVGIPR